MPVCSSDYECTAQILTDGNAKLSKYKSKLSGMTISIAEVNGPLVGGYLCVATEAHDDDGLPHTLEHLIFMGSEKYPYKGILDMLANRCLAQGTNAWTDTDHTCYTMTTAGDEGFLKLLPIYLDHLLYPTLTDSSFVTEVHHVNGEGEDAGVVYCEMQARENSGESLCHLAMLRSMYPGKCGYKSETGGLMKNLRESTTNEKVREYHKQFYRPENLNVIIVGQVEAEKVFEAIKPVEDRILQEGERPPFVRSWQTPVPELPESVLLEVDYPCDDDKYGLVIAAWRGPTAHDYSQLISIQVLMDYFTDTSVSPIKREMVEIEDPFCNQVDYTVIENMESCIYLHLSNVPENKLKEVKDKLFSVLEKIANGSEELDMERMRTLIRKKKLYILSSMESEPHDQMAACLIGDFLYGSTLEDLEHRVREIPTIEKLLTKDAQFWLDLLKTYIIDGNYVIVLGNPSSDLSDSMAEDDKIRIEEQKKKLGPIGLKEKADIFKKAIETNDVRAPEEMLSSVTVPSVKSIKFHPIKRCCNAEKTNISDVDFKIKDMPVRFQLDVINTNFVRFHVLMDTSNLTSELRMYLPLFVELLDECAIRRNGEIVPYQDVVKQLAEDTICISAGLGLSYSRFFCHQFAQLLALELMVEEEKYEKSVKWAREILYQIIFEPARIKSSIKKMIADVASVKRSGSAIVKIMMKNLCFQPESNHWVASALRQCAFLTKLQENLESNADEVVEKLNEVRNIIAKPGNMTIHLAINLDQLKQKTSPEQTWMADFLPQSLSPEITKSSVKKCHELLQSHCGETPKGYIASVGSVESSFLMQNAPGIKSWTDPDYAPLLVLAHYLDQFEGTMYRQIRGQGLAYTYSLFLDPDSGLTYFILFKCTHLFKAYKESINIIDSLLSGKVPWEKPLIESGSSSLIFETIERFKTVAYVAEESLTAYYRGIDMNYVQDLLEKISQVTESDMERVGNKYLRPLFDTTVSSCTVCCHPSKIKEIVENFKTFSRELTIVPSLEDSFMSKF